MYIYICTCVFLCVCVCVSVCVCVCVLIRAYIFVCDKSSYQTTSACLYVYYQ